MGRAGLQEKQNLMTGAELLTAALALGRRLLECGAEIYRVEESISRMCLAYGAADAQVYAVPTSIIATIRLDDTHTETQVCRIQQRGTDLGKVDALNALCRTVCAEPIPRAQFWARMRGIERMPHYSWPVRLLASGGVAMFFALLFGATLPEGILGFLVGATLEAIVSAVSHMGPQPLFVNVLGGAWVSFAALVGVGLGLGGNYDVVIIGAIMPLVPGLLMTNAIRDMIAGDFMAGIARFSEALLSAAGIAVGAAIPLAASSFLLGVL